MPTVGRASHTPQLWSVVAPEHQSMWLANHKRVCAGEVLVWEFDVVGFEEGVLRNMETHAAPIALSDGSTGQLAITRDVTARNQAREW